MEGEGGKLCMQPESGAIEVHREGLNKFAFQIIINVLIVSFHYT